MRFKVSLILLILTLQTLQVTALPYLEVSRFGVGQVIVRDEYALLKTEEGLILLEGGSERKLNFSEGSRVIEGRDVFVQSGGKLYEISSGGVREVAECEGCKFFPYSRERYALLTEEGLILRIDGKERRVSLRPQIVKWSEDGDYLAALSGSTVYAISKEGVIQSMSLSTQVFDIGLSKDLVIVATKNCEVYAYSISKGVAWTNRLCSCCIPLKLASSNDLVVVALQGEELVLLDPPSGRVVQRLSIPAYSVKVHDGLIAALDSSGVVRLLADSSRLELEGKSSGVLLTWDLPSWLIGSLFYDADGESGSANISRRSFIPLRSLGNLTLRLKDPNGVEVKREVVLKPLEVNLTPEGEVEVRGDGEFSVRIQGRIYEGARVKVDTGFLPQYTVEILNYGVLIGKYSCFNSRFMIISSALLLAAIALILAKRFLARGP